MLEQEEESDSEGDEPDRDVDVERPAPGEVLDEEPAEDGTGGWAKDGGEHEDAADGDALLGWESAVEHGHADGCEQAATSPLQHPEGDQLLKAASLSAEGRRADEEGKCDEEDAFGAEAIAQPTRRRDEDRQADEIGDNNRLGHHGRDVKLASQCDEGYIDDRRVERVHEHRGDIDGSDDVTLVSPA